MEKEIEDRVLIGSVFANDSEEQAGWLALQLAYIRATTKNFHHVTFIPSADRPINDYFRTHTELIPSFGDKTLTSNWAHLVGLEELLEYFKRHRGQYSSFLFLDSDAFPIRKNWLALLRARMRPPIEIAIAMRPENIEQRLHSSILMAMPEALDNLSWGIGCSGLDLVGNSEEDVTVPHYQFDNREKVYTLVRSNQHNVHPLLCGVYYDMFYHHGCGSGRAFVVRSQPYWAHAVEENVDVAALTRRLLEDPVRFVNHLAGWKPDEYATLELQWDGRGCLAGVK